MITVNDLVSTLVDDFFVGCYTLLTTKSSHFVWSITLWNLSQLKKIVCWNQHEKFYLLMKFKENLKWWVDWLGQLTWNDPSSKPTHTCKIDADNHLHNCIFGAFCVKIEIVQNILEITAKKSTCVKLLELCFLELSLCTFGANAAALIVSASKWFIPCRALICFARSVPRGRLLNIVAFAGDSFYSIRALQLYITVLKP